MVCRPLINHLIPIKSPFSCYSACGMLCGSASIGGRRTQKSYLSKKPLPLVFTLPAVYIAMLPYLTLPASFFYSFPITDLSLELLPLCPFPASIRYMHYERKLRQCVGILPAAVQAPWHASTLSQRSLQGCERSPCSS